MFSVTPQLFFLMGLSPVICIFLAIWIIKFSSGISILPKAELIKFAFIAYIMVICSLSFFQSPTIQASTRRSIHRKTLTLSRSTPQLGSAASFLPKNSHFIIKSAYSAITSLQTCFFLFRSVFCCRPSIKNSLKNLSPPFFLSCFHA